MPARIERFDQEIGVRDTPGTRPVIDQPDNAGGAFRQLGRTILRESEPFVKRRAEKLAEEDANAMKLKRNPDGSIEQIGDEREHYGIVYAETFDRIMQQRRGAMYQSTIEENLADLQAEHFLDPEAFRQASNGYLEGMLEAVDPRDRQFVEATGLREQTQRNNALVSEKRRRDFTMAVDAVEANMDADIQDAVNLLFAGGEENIAAALERLGPKMSEYYDQLEVLGASNEELSVAAMRKLQAGMWDEVRFAAEREALGDMLGQMDSDAYSNDDLRNLQIFMQGGDLDGATVAGKTAEEWREAFQTRPTRQLIEGFARDLESRRVTAANAEEARRREEARLETERATLREIKKINRDQSGRPVDITDEEWEQRVHAYQEFGTTSSQMMTPEGRVRTLGFIQQTGLAPPDLVSYLNFHSSGERIIQISEFVDNLNDMVVDGTPVGLNIFNSLNKNTQAAIMVDMALHRNGLSHEDRAAFAQQAAAREMPTMSQVHESYGGKSEYLKERTSLLEDSLGISEAQAARIVGASDFDAYVRVYSRAYGAGNSEALEQAARTVARQWAKSPIFIDGVAPLEVARFGATPRDFDTGLKPLQMEENTSGATFANGRAKLVPESVGPDRAIGWYRIQFYTSNGTPDRLSKPIELDGFIDEFARKTKQDREAIADAQMSLARQQRRQRQEPLSPELQRLQDAQRRGPKY